MKCRKITQYTAIKVERTEECFTMIKEALPSFYLVIKDEAGSYGLYFDPGREKERTKLPLPEGHYIVVNDFTKNIEILKECEFMEKYEVIS